MALASIALVWGVTLVSSFRYASREVQRWQDTRLIEFATLAALLDDEDLVRLALGAIPVGPASADAPWSAPLAHTEWRIYRLRDARSGRTIEVVQSSNSRSDLARSAALHIVRPVLIALPALALLVWLAIGRSLAPLRTLSETIRTRDRRTHRELLQRSTSLRPRNRR